MKWFKETSNKILVGSMGLLAAVAILDSSLPCDRCGVVEIPYKHASHTFVMKADIVDMELYKEASLRHGMLSELVEVNSEDMAEMNKALAPYGLVVN